jgi:CheY-like chemotaxis protein
MAITSNATCLCQDKHRDLKREAPPFRVLVIDDVRDAADSLRMLLELYGHEVRVAYTGTNAIEVALQFRPDAVLCDIAMPVVCGYEVAAALRNDPATAGARMIATTGFATDAMRENCRAAGFAGHMVKPIDVDELRAVLAAWAEERIADSIR